ncbi:MAG: carbamate kinase [Armatimonadetes bacterium]|nr:carbamate kinase [Armatimonadota bacterium]
MIAVVAIGGNSITKANQRGEIREQFQNVEETSQHLITLLDQGYNLVVTHGNGPQVGNVLLRVELALPHVYPLPLDTCVSDTQGGMGYMIQQVLGNVLRKRGIVRPVVTVLTQVVVDPDDPAFHRPTKPIGPFYSREKAEEYQKKKGWNLIEDAGRGYRRVVPSPVPMDIVERDAIEVLLKSGFIVVAVGGGGIPVVSNGRGTFRGVEAVIDKDLASSLLATSINADLFLISTDAEQVCLNYRKPEEKRLNRMTVAEARTYLAEGQFPPGSMGPKIRAAVEFLEKGGREVLITTPEAIGRALAGETGTRIVP